MQAKASSALLARRLLQTLDKLGLRLNRLQRQLQISSKSLLPRSGLFELNEELQQ
jgi:hypothetical protein